MLAAFLVLKLAAAAGPAAGLPSDVQELMDDAEYQKARKQMDRSLRSSRLSREQRVTLYAAHAVCDVSLGDEAAAAQSYQKLLTLDPAWRPDAARTSPKVLEVYEVVRGRLQEQGALESAFQPEFQPIPDAAPGEDVRVAVAFKGPPASSVERVFVRYRRVGDASFESAELKRAAKGNTFDGVIPETFLRADEDDYAVDYYLDAEDGQGERLTGVGTAVLPLQFRVTRPEAATARAGTSQGEGAEQARRVAAVVVPVVLGAVSLVVVAGVTGAVLALTTLDPGATHLWLRRFQ
ncbi:MAG: hypothetical protein AB2A00_35895 [Myxococcota bacterium]